jgi:hypothetical protein
MWTGPIQTRREQRTFLSLRNEGLLRRWLLDFTSRPGVSLIFSLMIFELKLISAASLSPFYQPNVQILDLSTFLIT